MKKHGKLTSLNAVMDKKRIASSQHVFSTYERISYETRIKKKQRTLDEMLHKMNAKKK